MVRIPSKFEEMPAVACADPSLMSLSELVAHVREAAIRWRIQHVPFWLATFARLRELIDDIRIGEATRLLVAFSHMRVVDEEVLEHCETVLQEAGGTALMDLKEEALVLVAEALGRMRRPDAMGDVLRPLVARVHRLEAPLVTRALRAAAAASTAPAPGASAAAAGTEPEAEDDDEHDADGSEAARELADAAARVLVAAAVVPADELAAFVVAAAAVAPAGPRTGVDRAFRHLARRAKDQPGQFHRHLDALSDAADRAGWTTSLWQAVLREAAAEGSAPSSDPA